MKYAVMDTETSGLFDYSKPADAPGQPRMAAFALCHLDAGYVIEQEESFLIRPDGWTMDEGDPEARDVHGLTQERLLAEGVPVATALRAYNQALSAGAIIVGFNTPFDLKVLRAELRHVGLPDRYATTLSIDCMRPMANVIKAATGAKYKLPKLKDAHAHVFGKEHDGAHGALGDARACAALFRHMIETRVLTEADLLGKNPK